jgi:hypothetical protein
MNGFTRPRLVDTSSGQFLNDPGVIVGARLTANTSVTNTATETTLFTLNIPADTLQSDRKLRFEAHLAISDPATTLTSRTLTLRLKFGTVTIATGTLQTSDSDGASVNAIGSSVGYILTAFLTADGSTGSQIGHIAISGPVAYSGLTGRVLGGFSTATTGRGTGSVDATAEKAFAITAQWSEAGSGRTVTIEAATLELV